MKKKIYHIHTDFKFLSDSKRFDSILFENIIIFIGDKSANNKDYHDTAIFYAKISSNVHEILQLVNDADLVVLYNLCDFKKLLLKNMRIKIKVAWRFFGHEYYATRRDLMLTERTSEIVENKQKYKRDVIYKFIIFLKYRKRHFLDYTNLKVIQKIDYIFLFSEFEYNFLKTYWKVPNFLKLNMDFRFDEISYRKKNSIIVGNSRSMYNNHIDILEIINNLECKIYQFNMFFSYGAIDRYSNYVKNIASKNENIFLIEDFLSKDDFEKIYLNSSALVINSHRQLALGNIFTAIKYGLKIYLNDKNPIKRWLEFNEILVSSTLQLKSDLENKSIMLSQEQMKYNIKKFNKLSDNYNQAQFCANLKNLI